jgi:hypothetical protein
VKSTFKLLLATAFIFTSFSLKADNDIEVEDLSAEKIQGKTSGGPFTIKTSTDFIGEAKFEHRDRNHFKNFTFTTGDIDLSFIYYYNPCLIEGASLGISYMRTRLDWKENPFFTQKDYDTVSLNFGGFSQRFKDWTWKGQVTINFDNIEHWTIEDYVNYDLVLWGRYAYRPNLGVHIGFLALTGMKIDRVYPIIGIDWTYNCHWKLSFVFPMDISVAYTINKCWEISLASRFFTQRHRVKKDQFFSRGLWFYTSSGAELAIKYTPKKGILVNVHVGEDFGGHLKVANRHYKEGRRLSFGAAPYAGAEIDINF